MIPIPSQPSPRLALRCLLLAAIAISCWSAGEAVAENGAGEQELKLWYTKPASHWVEALPIGNGRLGAMIYGGISNEDIQFNEDTLWTGQPHEYQHPGAVQFLPTI